MNCGTLLLSMMTKASTKGWLSHPASVVGSRKQHTLNAQGVIGDRWLCQHWKCGQMYAVQWIDTPFSKNVLPCQSGHAWQWGQCGGIVRKNWKWDPSYYYFVFYWSTKGRTRLTQANQSWYQYPAFLTQPLWYWSKGQSFWQMRHA